MSEISVPDSTMYATLEDPADVIGGPVCDFCNNAYWETSADFHVGCLSGGDPSIPVTTLGSPGL